MGNVCCCRSRAASNECGGAGTANSPADSSNDSDAHASNVDAESVAPADVAIGTVTLAVDSLLAVGEAVPVVGDFFDLIAHFTTPLDAASQHGHPAVVRLLLDAQR